MFIILKPEMRRCVESLDPYLKEAGFNIDSRCFIADWKSVALKIYAPQLKDSTFAAEFNVYLWMTNSLFGNSAVVYRLSRVKSLSRNLIDLIYLKSKFREDAQKKFDAPINFMIDLDKINTDQPIKIGKCGVICIGDIPLKRNKFNGRWDYFFFKYIHTFDDKISYLRENNIFIEHGIYNHVISNLQWTQMVATETLTPFIEDNIYRDG